MSFLRNKFFGNNSTTDQVILHTLNELKRKKNLEFKEIFLLMPTCPNRSVDDIIKFNDQLLNDKKIEMLSTVVKYPHFLNPTYSLVRKKENYYFNNISKIKKKSNLIPDQFTLTGSIRYAKVDKFKKIKSMINKKTQYFEVTFQNSVDIDKLEDFKLAEKLSK